MGLYQKIHAVMIDSEALDKSMTVGFGANSYKAISEASVLNLVKPLLKKHGLVIFPVSVHICEIKDIYNNAKGETTRLMSQVVATYKIVDIDTGEFELLATVGNGCDTQDKASGKALTYGYKALLQKTFCLFSGEDTDNTHSDAMDKQQTYSKKETVDTNNLIVTANKKGFGAATVEKKLIEIFGHGMEHLTQAENDSFIEKLEILPDKK